MRYADLVFFTNQVPDTSNTNATRATRMRHKYNTSNKSATQLRCKCYTYNTSETRVKNFDFDKYKSENIFSQVVENDVTWERFEPRAKIQENKI